MTTILKISFGALLFLGSSMALACDYPDHPHIPNGDTATKDELLVAKSAVQGYIAAVDEYLTCIENEEKASVAELDNPPTEELQRRDDLLNKKFDAANEQKELVGEQFNQQIRAFNQKLKESNE